MTNEHYLIVSYFLFGLVSLGLGVAAYLALRRPFAAIAEMVAGHVRSALLKRTLALSIVMAAVLGFTSVSYRGCGMSYEEIVRERSYLEQINRQQLQHASNWIVYVVLAWGVAVVLCVAVLRQRRENSGDGQ